MPRFTTLLDPREIIVSEHGSNIGEQALAAQHRFPEVATASHLNLWKPGDPISSGDERFLLGLAVSFALEDLCFADVVNEAVGPAPRSDVVIDLFDLSSVQDLDELADYFCGWRPVQLHWGMHPLVGRWQDRQFRGVLSGYEGMQQVLNRLDCRTTPADIVSAARTSDPSLFS